MDGMYGNISCDICGYHDHKTSEHHTHGKHIGHEFMERGENSFHGYFHKSKKERTETI